jgi:hypothetical protein
MIHFDFYVPNMWVILHGLWYIYSSLCNVFWGILVLDCWDWCSKNVGFCIALHKIPTYYYPRLHMLTTWHRSTLYMKLEQMEMMFTSFTSNYVVTSTCLDKAIFSLVLGVCFNVTTHKRNLQQWPTRNANSPRRDERREKPRRNQEILVSRPHDYISLFNYDWQIVLQIPSTRINLEPISKSCFPFFRMVAHVQPDHVTVSLHVLVFHRVIQPPPRPVLIPSWLIYANQLFCFSRKLHL